MGTDCGRGRLGEVAQLNLFGASLPPGLRYAADLISTQEEAELLASLEDVEVAPFRFQGWEGKRETASFGWAYDFEGGGLARAAPMPAFLLGLRDRAARFAGVEAQALAHTLIIRYGPDAGIGWHRDRPVFGEVIGVSLGSAAALRLRLRTPGGFKRCALPLPPRSAYLLTGAARHDWEHSILPTGQTRWSVTFRTLRATPG
jgi:DNA oxidative demethylase